MIAQINPLSRSAKQGRTIVASIEAHWAEIEARRRELEERAWAFKMQQYNDAKGSTKERTGHVIVSESVTYKGSTITSKTRLR